MTHTLLEKEMTHTQEKRKNIIWLTDIFLGQTSTSIHKVPVHPWNGSPLTASGKGLGRFKERDSWHAGAVEASGLQAENFQEEDVRPG